MQRIDDNSEAVKKLFAFSDGLYIINQHPNRCCFNDNFELRPLSSQTPADPVVVINKITQLFEKCIASKEISKISHRKINSIFLNIEEFSNRTQAFDPLTLQQKIITPIRDSIFKDDVVYQGTYALLTAQAHDLTGSDIEFIKGLLKTLSIERDLISVTLVSIVLEQLEALFNREFNLSGGKLRNWDERPGYDRFSWEHFSAKNPEDASIALALQTAFLKNDQNEIYETVQSIAERKDSLSVDSKKTLFLWQLYLFICHSDILTRLNNEHLARNYAPIAKHTNSGGKLLSNDLQCFLQNSKDTDTNDCFKNLTDYNNTFERYLDPYYINFIDDIYTKLYEKLMSAPSCSIPTNVRSPQEFSEITLRQLKSENVEIFFRDKILNSLSELLSGPQDLYLRMIMLDFFGFKEKSKLYTSLYQSVIGAFDKELERNLPIFKKLKGLDVQKQPQKSISEKELCDDLKKHLNLNSKQKKRQKASSKKRKGRSRPHKGEHFCVEKEKEEEPKPILKRTSLFSLIPVETLFSTRKITCDERVYDWFSKEPKILKTDSYSKLSKVLQKKQKLFHCFPIEITKIALLRGIKSTWHTESRNKENPHYSIIGQIERYKPGKEVVYTGVFTDCFDARNINLLYHHHFVEYGYNAMLDNFSKDGRFQTVEELKQAMNSKTNRKTQQREFLSDKERFQYEQGPGTVTIDDTKKKIRYTVLLPT